MLHKNDALILMHLRANARRNITGIAKETGIPTSTIFDKIKRLERSCILKHTSLLDFRKLEYERAKLLVKLDNQDKERFVETMKRHQMVNNFYKVNSKYDFLLEIVFQKLEDYHRFLEEMHGFNILLQEDYYVIEDLKREGFFPT